MKSIYLKSVLAFIFVGVMAMLICGLFYNDYLEQQPATPEQLTEIIQDTPCAAEAFKEAIKSDTSDYQPEPLSLGKAKELASACRERNEMAEVKRVRENERNKIREKQIQPFNDPHSVKERYSWFPVKSLHLLFVLWFQEWYCVIYPRPQTDIFLF